MRKYWNKNDPDASLPSNVDVELSDSWEGAGSSPDNDAVLPFEMDPDHEYHNLLGRIRGSFSENSGVIEFRLHGQPEGPIL